MRSVRVWRWAFLVTLALALLFAAHFLLERRQGRLVGLRLGDPLLGAPVLPAPAPTASSPRRVWIETDAGCGAGEHVDVDDCFALALALSAPELEVRGIGTLHGNVPAARADSITRELVRRVRPEGAPPIFRGAVGPGDGPTDASRALADELARGPLTLLAFGPLTDVSAALAAHPERAANLAEVVAVAGKRSGQWMHPGYDHLVTFSDFNVAQDSRAASRLLATRIPVTLVPFEAALAVTITPRDLDSLAARGDAGRWLRARSQGWLRFWRREAGRDGFVPFDGAAVVYVLQPPLLRCVRAFARLERSPPWFGIGRPTEMVVSADPSGRRAVSYCGATVDGFEQMLKLRLATIGSR